MYHGGSADLQEKELKNLSKKYSIRGWVFKDPEDLEDDSYNHYL